MTHTPNAEPEQTLAVLLEKIRLLRCHCNREIRRINERGPTTPALAEINKTLRHCDEVFAAADRLAAQRPDAGALAIQDVERLLRSALYDLHEGLTAALPEDERAWLLRERFKRAEQAVEKALVALTPSATVSERVGGDE